MEDSFNTVNSVPQPSNINVRLFPHQLSSIYNMEQMEKTRKINISDTHTIYTQIGFNADPVGYGKTLSMIGLIARDKMEWDLNTLHNNKNYSTGLGGKIVECKITKYNRIPATLVLVSQSTIGQWEYELRKTTLTFSSVKTKRNIGSCDPFENDVILIIPTMYNLFIREHANYFWKRFIFDEPAYIKIPSMKEIKTGFYWFVCANPYIIYFSHRNCKNSFMKTIFSDVNNRYYLNEFLDNLIVRNPLEFVQQSFIMPETIFLEHLCYQPIFNIVKNFVCDNIRRMVEAGNIEEAITSLGGKKTDDIISLVQKKKQDELLEIESKIRIYVIRNDQVKINKWVSRKNSIEEELNSIKDKFEERLNNICNICMEPLNHPILEPNCQNLFCGSCLLTWLSRVQKCPLCRNAINSSDLVYIKNSGEEGIKSAERKTGSLERKMTKIEKVIEVIHNKPDGKFIIFSDYERIFSPICEALIDNNITFIDIKGTSTSRQNSLDNFKNGNITVLFLNSSINAAGINLQEATDIILYHIMSESTINQIIGRANRIGRKSPLSVHTLKII